MVVSYLIFFEFDYGCLDLINLISSQDSCKSSLNRLNLNIVMVSKIMHKSEFL